MSSTCKIIPVAGFLNNQHNLDLVIHLMYILYYLCSYHLIQSKFKRLVILLTYNTIWQMVNDINVMA